MSQANKNHSFDFEHICRSFGLILHEGGAVNMSVIIAIDREPGSGFYTFVMPEGVRRTLTDGQMADLDAAIVQREKDVARIRAEAIEREAQTQIRAQMSAANDAIAAANIQSNMTPRIRRGGS